MEDESERIYERGVISEQPDGSVQELKSLLDHQNNKILGLQKFIIGVNRLLKTVKFTQFEAEA
jgi:hypothetical protein